MQPSTTTTGQETRTPRPRKDARAPQILAKTLFKDMMQNGLTNEQILGVSAELIALVTAELRANSESRKGNA